MFRLSHWCYVFLISASGMAHAGDVLSIQEATVLALTRHPLTAAIQSELRAAEGLQQQAAYRPNPELEAGVGRKETDTDSGYAVDVTVAVPVERKGKREARIGIAESERAVAEAAAAELRRDVELQVRTLAYEWLSASADAGIAQEIAERSRAMIELLKQRPVAGPAMLLELQIIEASLVEFQKSAREFSAQRDIARRNLNLLLGRAPDAPLELKDTLDVPATTYSLDALMQQLDHNPGLLKRLAEAKRALHEVEAARAEARPDYYLAPYISREEAGEEETTIGLAVQLPLAWRNRNQGAMAAASARHAAAEAQVAAGLLEARSEIARVHRLYEAAVEQVNAISPELVARLHDAADLADRQYRLGAIPVNLFLDMQREFLSVQLLRRNALLDALKKQAELRWISADGRQEGVR